MLCCHNVYKAEDFLQTAHSKQSSTNKQTQQVFISIGNMKVLVILAVLIGVALTMPSPGRYGGGGGGGYGHGSGNSNIYHQQQTDHYGYAGPYKFGYTVNDPYTGDYHGRHESGDGKGGVTGSYHLREPNGHVREVKYVADYNGFRAYVNGVPHGHGGYH